MVAELPVEVCTRVAKLWLNGDNFRAIQPKTGVSLGAIPSRVNQEKSKAPDTDPSRCGHQTLDITASVIAHMFRSGDG